MLKLALNAMKRSKPIFVLLLTFIKSHSLYNNERQKGKQQLQEETVRTKIKDMTNKNRYNKKEQQEEQGNKKNNNKKEKEDLD